MFSGSKGRLATNVVDAATGHSNAQAATNNAGAVEFQPPGDGKQVADTKHPDAVSGTKLLRNSNGLTDTKIICAVAESTVVS